MTSKKPRKKKNSKTDSSIRLSRFGKKDSALKRPVKWTMMRSLVIKAKAFSMV